MGSNVYQSVGCSVCLSQSVEYRVEYFLRCHNFPHKVYLRRCFVSLIWPKTTIGKVKIMDDSSEDAVAR